MQEGLDQITRIIQTILTPVVMVTACALLISGVQQRYIAMGDRLRLMNSERLTLVRALLAGHSDHLTRPRLTEIAAQAPRIIHRHRLVRNATGLLYLAIGCYISTMLFLTVADVVGNGFIASLALLGFLVGTVVMLGGIVVMANEIYASHDEVAYEVHHNQQLVADALTSLDSVTGKDEQR